MIECNLVLPQQYSVVLLDHYEGSIFGSSDLEHSI